MTTRNRHPAASDLNPVLRLLVRDSTSKTCEECKRLERVVQTAIANISFVVSKRFPRFAEKVQQLHKWQDARDSAMQGLSAHRKTHTRDDAA